MSRHITLSCCLWAAVAVVASLCAPAASGAGVDAGLVNPSFEAALDAQGRVPGWEGNPGQLALVDVDHRGRRGPPAGEARPYGGKALAIAKGGAVSQTVPATAGRHYALTVLAHTRLIPEPEGDRFRSTGRLELTFLPSETKLRADMISPFGDSREFVDYFVGGQAPEGTQHVRVALSAPGSDVKVDDVRLVAHE
ncbi:MAG: hypothetical protein FJ279_24440, partial [Planctomycetes bacterium]|nr:hypothetical protein [Planctomycetota bacterium]